MKLLRTAYCTPYCVLRTNDLGTLLVRSTQYEVRSTEYEQIQLEWLIEF